jgi:adenylate cyclase
MNTTNPMDAVERCLAFHVRDWSTESRDAWLYGVVCGWNAAAMRELVEAHGWTPDQVKRLKQQHAAWKKLAKQMERE